MNELFVTPPDNCANPPLSAWRPIRSAIFETMLEGITELEARVSDLIFELRTGKMKNSSIFDDSVSENGRP